MTKSNLWQSLFHIIAPEGEAVMAEETWKQATGTGC